MRLPKLLHGLAWVWGTVLFSLLVLLFVGFALSDSQRAPVPVDTLLTVRLTDPAGGTTDIPVEVALTPSEQQRGLMGRSTVATGMLFVFTDEQQRAFWMKNTLVPLDIAYFAASGAWVSSARMEPCVADPCPTYLSAGPAMYALELPVDGIGARIGRGWTLRRP